jgi:predicted anti-sigma-YlaC factor YlaD
MMSARLDGRLDSTTMALLENHLAGCSACRAEWHQLQTLDNLLASASMIRAPAYLRVHVVARLNRREQARRAVVGGTALALGTVALALLALAPVLLGLLEATGIAPALTSGGPETIVQVLAFLSTVGRALLVLADKLAIPLAFLGLCNLGITLTLNGLWIGAMRRLRVTT